MTRSRSFALCALLALLSAGIFLVPAPAGAVPTVKTVAGTGASGYNGDGIPADTAKVFSPMEVSFDAAGNLYIADFDNNRIRKVSATTGLISTIAGTGVPGYNGDGILATSAKLYNPTGIKVDAAGNMYIADQANHRIRKVTAATGIITTIAGTGSGGYNGDNIPATTANLWQPATVTFDGAGNMYIFDEWNARVRKVTYSGSVTGTITTVAGTGIATYNGDGISATVANLASTAVGVLDSAGNLVFSDPSGHRVRKIDFATGLISTVAGTGTNTYNGDGILATAANIGFPGGIVFDAAGNLFIADYWNNRIRRVDVTTGLISTVAGSGVAGDSPDGTPALSAAIKQPLYLTFDAAGRLHWSAYIHRVRRMVSVELSATLSISPASPAPGQAFTYNIVVGNVGNESVTNLLIVDTLPAQVTMTGQTSIPALAWNGSTTIPAWTGIGDLEPGQSATVTISATAATCVSASVFDTVYARGDAASASPQRSASATFLLVSPAPAPALSVAASHTPSVPGSLSPVTFTLVVTNAGAATITSLTIVDSLPTGVVMTGESNTGGLAWNGNSAVPAWSGPVVLSPGQGITVTVNAATTCAGGVMSHRGWAYATAACATAQAASPADAFSLPNGTVLVATLTVSPSSPTSGAAVRYTLVVTNAGAATVTSLTITDSVPAAVVFTGQGNSAGLTWNGSPTVPAWTGAVTLLPGQSITVTVDAVASSTHSGVVTNTGWVLGTGGCGSVQASAAASFTLQPPDELGRDGVKIVGGIRGYIQPKRGEQATILVRPATAGPITVRIYNLRGELVRQLDANATGGRTEVLHWNATDSAGNDVPPGAYPIVIEGPGIRVRDTLAVLR